MVVISLKVLRDIGEASEIAGQMHRGGQRVCNNGPLQIPPPMQCWQMLLMHMGLGGMSCHFTLTAYRSLSTVKWPLQGMVNNMPSLA